MIFGTGGSPVAVLMSVGIFFGKGAADRTSIPPDGGFVAVAVLNDYAIVGDLMAFVFCSVANSTGSLMTCAAG